jgi:hypothetical protein
MKSTRMRLAEHVVQKGERTNADKLLVEHIIYKKCCVDGVYNNLENSEIAN